MTDKQPSNITQILGDITSESLAPGAVSLAESSDQTASGDAIPRHGAKRAHDDDGESGDSADNRLASFEKKPGVDLSAVKGWLIRLPGVGRILRIGMAILRLPKRLDGIMDSISQLSDQTMDIENRLHGEIGAVQGEVATVNTQQRQLSRAVEAVSDSPIGTDNERMVREYFHALAERFRGSFDDVKAKMALYVPHIKAEAVDFSQFPAVDLACGRCEWAELMRENGIACTGVDSNPEVIAVAKERNLEATCTDLFSYLESLGNDTVGIVTGFHIIEHLNTTQKLLLFREAKRVLVPGGLLILETPNSENLLVSSHSFFYDPSHHNPIPVQALEFMAQHFGYELVNVVRHSPLAQPELAGDGNAERYLAKWLGKEQDYGLIVRKFPGHGAQRRAAEGDS